MKNWTLALAIGTAVATTVIGLQANPASAYTITGVKATKLDVVGNLFLKPGQTSTDVILKGYGFFTWENAQNNEVVNYLLKIDMSPYLKGKFPGTEKLQKNEGKFDFPIFGVGTNLGAGKYTATFTISVNPSNTITRDFEVKKVPEPLTILGTGIVLSALPVLKKEYAKRNKKKDEDA
jgi:hypothetical protein